MMTEREARRLADEITASGRGLRVDWIGESAVNKGAWELVVTVRRTSSQILVTEPRTAHQYMAPAATGVGRPPEASNQQTLF